CSVCSISLVVFTSVLSTSSPLSFTLLFFFYSYAHHRDLHSFPTRRSSDLQILETQFLMLLPQPLLLQNYQRMIPHDEYHLFLPDRNIFPGIEHFELLFGFVVFLQYQFLSLKSYITPIF